MRRAAGEQRLVRFQIYFSARQLRALRRRARLGRTTVSAVLRRLVEKELAP